MKKSLLLAIFAFAAYSASAQDIIAKKNMEKIEAKVLSVGVDEIEYKRSDNPDGPVYSIRRKDVFMIKYQNGTHDVISPMNSSLEYKTISAKYQGEVAFAYVVADKPMDRIVVETVHGARITPYFFAGAGAAFNYMHSVKDQIEDKHAIVIPVFANLKGYYPFSHKSAVYLSLDMGAAIGVSAFRGTNLYVSAGPGVKFGHGDFSIRFQSFGTGSGGVQFRIGANF